MMKRLKGLMGSAAAAAGGGRLALHNRIVILAFHRISELHSSTGIDYGVKQFDALCSFLARNMRVVSLREQVASLGDRNAAGGTISITFDDGYLDNFTTAAPILERHGLNATFFIATGFIGTDTVPRWDRQFPVPPPWMTWDHVVSLRARGFDIGCHTRTHADLGRISRAHALEELQESRAELQRRLGVDAKLFAYPFGGRQHISPENRQLVRELGFICCVSCHGGTNTTDADPFDLRRVPVNEWYESPQQLAFELLKDRLLARRQVMASEVSHA